MRKDLDFYHGSHGCTRIKTNGFAWVFPLRLIGVHLCDPWPNSWFGNWSPSQSLTFAQRSGGFSLGLLRLASLRGAVKRRGAVERCCAVERFWDLGCLIWGGLGVSWGAVRDGLGPHGVDPLFLNPVAQKDVRVHHGWKK